MKVRISLFPGYGLGDAVQMSAVLQHVVAARPDWSIDFYAERGRETVGRGIVDRCFVLGAGDNDCHYDLETEIVLYDTRTNWTDRPNTRVVSCLHERFGLPWRAELGRYRIQPTPVVLPPRTVAVHYRGDSAPDLKNLSVECAERVCERVVELGRTPLILDWRPDPLVPKYGGVRGLGLYGGSAADVCGVIAACEAFVGIDSGPAKCASATNTPSLVVWTRNNPEYFHDPAPNTTHDVPADMELGPFFRANYRTEGVMTWLQKTLRG